jgi:hypothetical protein
MKWIDVRDVWPVYFDGFRGVRLVNVRRDVDLGHAERHAAAVEEGRRCYVCDPIGLIPEVPREDQGYGSI